MIKRGKNPISKVVFYEIEMNGEKIREAAIFRKDGVYIEDKEIGIDALYELAKENGCKTMSEFETSNYFEVLSEENLKNKYPNIYQVAKNGEEDLELSSETETKDQNFAENENKVKNLQKLLDKFHIKKFMAKTSIYLLAGGFALFGGINLGKKLYNKAVNSKTKSQKEENSKFDYITTEQKLDDINSTENETATDMLEKYGSVDEILKQSNINQTKSTTLSKIWSYLKNYNKTISKQYQSNTSNTRLAHTWDEVIVDYLAYNDISKEEVNKVFEHYNINLTTFKEAYQSGYRQDVLAYTVLEKSTNKADIINSQEGKEFYQKYEDLIINYNNTYDKSDEDLEKVANVFYETIRQDFDINQSTETIEKYKLSVIPIIEAFDNMLENSNFENILTSDEKAYFKELADFNIIESHINDLSNSLYSYNIAVDTLNEVQEEYTYSQIKEAAIAELANDQAYNIDDIDRDISDHSEYQEKFIKTTEKTTETTNNNNINGNTNSSNNYDDAGMVDDDEAEDEIPDWMLEEDNQEEETTEEKNTTTEANDNEADYIYDIEEDTPSTNVDDDNYENTDDSIKDITTDEENASPKDSLPDPNNDAINNYKLANEVVAEFIIDEMTNTPSFTEYNYQYTKK